MKALRSDSLRVNILLNISHTKWA